MFVRISGIYDGTKGQSTHYLLWDENAQNYVCCSARDLATEFDDVTDVARAVATHYARWGDDRQSEGAVVTVVELTERTVIEEKQI